MSLFAELRRRNVIRMAGLYLVAAWVIVQVAETVLPTFEVPAWVLRAIIIVIALGFFPALIFAWVFELTPEGLKRDAEVDRSRSIASRTGQRMNVMIGVLLSGLFFAWKIAQIFRVTSTLSEDGKARVYLVEGQLFFASADRFTAAFDFRESLERVTIDVSRAHIWDISSVSALDMVVLKFRREGADVEIVGLNRASETMVDKLAIHDQPGALERLMGH